MDLREFDKLKLGNPRNIQAQLELIAACERWRASRNVSLADQERARER
jgi:hypothetical protein